MTNKEWVGTLHKVTNTLIENCACTVSKCSDFNNCKECVEKWLDDEHQEASIYILAEENDKELRRNNNG